MHIFALETDLEKLKRALLSPGEREVLSVRFHPALFYLRALWALLLTLLLALFSAMIWQFGIPLLWVIVVAVIVWCVFIFMRVVRALIDWRYDLLMVTTDKIVVIDQSSVLHSSVRQMNIENLATVHSETQMLNLFPFGRLCFDLKEGIGARLCLPYIPRAERVASEVSQAIRQFQLRRSGMDPAVQQPAQSA